MDEFIIESALHTVSNAEVIKAIDVLREARENKRGVYIFGNGGSATTASHFAQDLQKQCGVKAVSLSDSVPSITAWANDVSFDYVFIKQLSRLAQEGDVAIAISVSGRSHNVVWAIDWAKRNSLKTIGLIGYRVGAGMNIKDIADIAVTVVSSDYGLVEDVHLAICHAITKQLGEL